MERLPRDAMIDIISRLPIKYVVCCKSVSKSLEAHLSDPFFAAAHFSRASTLTPFSDYITCEGKELLYFTEASPHLDAATTSNYLKFCPLLMSSCLGYVCFSAKKIIPWGGSPSPTNPIYLFNPITRASILLPQFKEPRCYSDGYGIPKTRANMRCPQFKLSWSTGVYGFGFDVSTQECKVVLVYLREKTFLVQVHTVGRDYSWRTNRVPTVLTDVTEAELMNRQLQTSLPLEFNGTIHWIVLSSIDKEDDVGPKRACILSFQLDTEVVGVIPMPEPLQVINPRFYDSMIYALQVSGGCLSIIYSPEESYVDMWVMADYNIPDSWVKKYSIRLKYMRGYELRPLGFRKNGELVLHMKYQGLVSCRTDSDRYEIFRFGYTRFDYTIPFPFAGSLISLKSAYEDSKVVGTSRFGNPIQKQHWTMRIENGVCHLHKRGMCSASCFAKRLGIH